MNRKAFIQQASITMMLHPYATEKPQGERVDAAINLAEALWERLKDRGYGPTTATSERSSRDYYAEIEDQESFDRCRIKFKDKGNLQDAAKAWIGIEESEKPKLFGAICRYLEDIATSGTAKAHLSTWYNGKRWLNYPEPEKKPETKSRHNEKAAMERHLLTMIAHAPTEEHKAELQSQLDNLRNG
jgi:hypothetical protein